MIRQFELVEKVRAYDKNVDEALLNLFGASLEGQETDAQSFKERERDLSARGPGGLGGGGHRSPHAAPPTPGRA